jgi:hypothetical protein
MFTGTFALICVMPFVASETSVLRGVLQDPLLSEVEAATIQQTTTTNDMLAMYLADGGTAADGIFCAGGAADTISSWCRFS